MVALLLCAGSLAIGNQVNAQNPNNPVSAVNLVSVRGSTYEVTSLKAVKRPTKFGIPYGRKYWVYDTLNGYPLRLNKAERNDNKAALKGVADYRTFEQAHPYANGSIKVGSLVFSIITAVR